MRSSGKNCDRLSITEKLHGVKDPTTLDEGTAHALYHSIQLCAQKNHAVSAHSFCVRDRPPETTTLVYRDAAVNGHAATWVSRSRADRRCLGGSQRDQGQMRRDRDQIVQGASVRVVNEWLQPGRTKLFLACRQTACPLQLATSHTPLRRR
ncbi:hypothetical protein AB1Y20_004972 [Prymnesium parvum]|uniref:Uncharacterized protein n=1 Tax=Prymnesium parvum TaxID=97485 RepID=A0AB34J2U5_PRYPA